MARYNYKQPVKSGQEAGIKELCVKLNPQEQWCPMPKLLGMSYSIHPDLQLYYLVTAAPVRTSPRRLLRAFSFLGTIIIS